MSNKIAVVIGMGANSLEIPLLVFPDTKTANDYLQNLGLVATDPEDPSIYDLDEDKMLSYDPETDEDIDNPLVKALFKDGDYYDGCGGCYCLEVREVEFGTPIVGWDLD